jgi:uncharacterized membrane protein
MNPLRGTRGHPSHPPITDAVIGMYTLAAALAVIGSLGWIEDAAGKGMWLALVGGLIASAGAAVTGLLDWLAMERGTPLWRTATTHMAVMVTAVVLFGIGAIVQYDGFHDGAVETGGLVLTLLGWATLAAGGWLGGSLVFVHGHRVVGDEQAGVRTSADPLAHERGASRRRGARGISS